MVKQLQTFFFLIFSTTLLLSGCGTTPDKTEEEQQTITTESETALQLNTINNLIRSGDYLLAEAQIVILENHSLSDDEFSQLQLSKARLTADIGSAREALQLLNSASLQDRLLLSSNQTQAELGLFKAELLEAEGFYFSAAKFRSYLAPLIADQSSYIANHYAIWNNLNQLTADDILNQVRNDNSIFDQWLPLSLMLQHTDKPLNQQIATLKQWQQQHPTHPAALIPLPEMAAIHSAAAQRPERIAILLPFDGKYSKVGEAIRDGLMFSYFQTEYRPQLSFYAIDSSMSFIDSYNDAVADGAQMIIGPLFKSHLQELYQLTALPVPTIALNKLDQSQKPLNLIEFSMAQEDEIDSLIKLASQYQHKRAAIVSQQSSWAEKASAGFTDKWLNAGNEIATHIEFTSTRQQSQAIQQLLNIDRSNQRIRELRWLTGANIQSEPRRRQDIDMITLLAKPEPAASIRPLLAFHYASDIPVFATSSVYRGFNDRKKDNDLNGIRITDIPLVINQTNRVSDKYQHSPLVRMYAFGMDAFQLAERFQLLAALPQQKLYGATGELHIVQQAIIRETAFAEFRRGRIKHIAKLTQADDETIMTPLNTAE